MKIEAEKFEEGSVKTSVVVCCIKNYVIFNITNSLRFDFIYLLPHADTTSHSL